MHTRFAQPDNHMVRARLPYTVCTPATRVGCTQATTLFATPSQLVSTKARKERHWCRMACAKPANTQPYLGENVSDLRLVEPKQHHANDGHA